MEPSPGTLASKETIMTRTGTLVALIIAGLGVSAERAMAQGLSDLLGNRESPAGTSTRPEARLAVAKDRTDLRLSANVVPNALGRTPGGGEVGISANLDLDFICGRFDLKSTFQNLLGKEIREEFLQGALGYLQGELAGSAMELLCQAQPTLCTLLQNHNIAANLKLGYHYDRCRAIESAIDHSQKRIYASAIDECLREKQARGIPLSEALDACRRADRVRGFGGEPLAEFDLARELRKVVSLSEEGQKLLGKLAEETRYGGSWASTRPNASILETRHEEVKRDFLDRWTRVVEKSPQRGGVSEDDLRKLVPPGYPPVTRDEVQRLSFVSPSRKEAALGSITSAIALSELTREIHEVERALEALAGAPSIEEGQRRLLEGRMLRLRKERTRLEEDYRDMEFYQNAYLTVKNLADGETERRVARANDRIALDVGKRGLVARTRAWGSSERDASASAYGRGPQTTGGNAAGCGNCGLEYSLGAVAGQR
jgi:hypothetical protein